MHNELTLWIGFNIFILIMLALDLFVIQRKTHVIKVKEALIWSAIWVVLALIFNVFIYHEFGKTKALEYFTGYLLERSLSIDNIFVFILLFSYFKVEQQYHHKILFWGVIGALILRALLIWLGSALVSQFEWVIYIFGAFLLITGFRMGFQSDADIHPENNVIIRFFKKILPVTSRYHGGDFFVRQGGKLHATPMIIVLLSIEVTDLIFAFDSIPAIFAVTRDPFIIYSSNIFAVLGLRTTYFALSGIMNKFHYLRVGLSMILVFIGIKMLIMDFYKISIFFSLTVIALILAASIVFSIVMQPGKKISKKGRQEEIS